MALAAGDMTSSSVTDTDPLPDSNLPGFIKMQIPSNSCLSPKIPVTPEDLVENTTDFPKNKVDRFGEPLDCRRKTTFNSVIGEFAGGELLETQLINVTAPLMIINQLSSYLKTRYPVYHTGEDEITNDELKSIYFRYKSTWRKLSNIGPPLSFVNHYKDLFDYGSAELIQDSKYRTKVQTNVAGRRPKVIVNVVSQEGQFLYDGNGIVKRGSHPALDVTKAGLNMITCSLASDLMKYDCYIVSVDPGWYCDNRPYGSSPVNIPLSVEDAAARVLWPIFCVDPFSHGAPIFNGKLMKNFQVVNWDGKFPVKNKQK